MDNNFAEHAGIIPASALNEKQVEEIEKITAKWVHLSLLDFGMEAYKIFLLSPDEVKDVAEDVTREVLDRLSGYNIGERVYGNVDYKKARYIILSDHIIRQALFVDSKAEKNNSSATLQMSQTTMAIRQIRSNKEVHAAGFLPYIWEHDNLEFLTTTAIIHYKYKKMANTHILEEATLACIPNGLLQDFYNPTVDDTIWIAGRDAPTLGEDFRVRLSFSRLEKKKEWRVQRIKYDAKNKLCIGEWKE